jgi:transcriptional/translational regulatory protein YebC/TACO1
VVRDGTLFQVTCAPEELAAVREAVAAAGFAIESASLAMVPKTTVTVAEEAEARKLVRLMEALEENEDVQEVYANFDIPEPVLEAAAS